MGPVDIIPTSLLPSSQYQTQATNPRICVSQCAFYIRILHAGESECWTQGITRTLCVRAAMARIGLSRRTREIGYKCGGRAGDPGRQMQKRTLPGAVDVYCK